MRLGFSLQEKEIQVDEDLPNFFTTILLSQADEIVNEEKNNDNEMKCDYIFELLKHQNADVDPSLKTELIKAQLNVTGSSKEYTEL